MLASLTMAAVEGAPKSTSGTWYFLYFSRNALFDIPEQRITPSTRLSTKGHKKLGFLLRIIIRVADYDRIVFLFQIIADAPDNLRIKKLDTSGTTTPIILERDTATPLASALGL